METRWLNLDYHIQFEMLENESLLEAMKRLETIWPISDQIIAFQHFEKIRVENDNESYNIGKWMSLFDEESEIFQFQCSICKNILNEKNKICPNCGAHMMEEERIEELKEENNER